MAAAVWWYFAAKIIELLDTIFFVLRKKNRQITFLHLYHHFMMPICAWIGVKFLPGLLRFLGRLKMMMIEDNIQEEIK